MSISNEIIFALNTSMVDLRDRRIPNFKRPSPVYLETDINNNISLSPVPSNVFAVSDTDGSFYIEPSGANLLTYNIDLSQNVWEKGSNVNVTPDASPAPDSSFLADRVTWMPSTLGGTPQLLRRSVAMRPGETYQFWGLLQLISGVAGAKDVFRVSSFDSTTTYYSKPLSELNNFVGKYRIFHQEIIAPGDIIEVPQIQTPSGLVNVAASSFTIALSGITSNQFVGAHVGFGDEETYRITSNTATDGSGNVVVTVDSTNLITDGVTTSSVASFSAPPDVVVWLEFYSESLLSVNFGGVFLEKNTFRTSAIYQRESLLSRSGTLLKFQPKDNILAGRSNFGVYVDLQTWRGNGGLLDFGDFKIEIANKKLKASAGNTIVSDPDNLTDSARVFVAINPETASLSLYVNGYLKSRQSISGFTPSLKPFVIPDDGVRRYQEIVVFGRALTDGKPEIGQVAGAEVAELFSVSPTPYELIAGHLPRLILPAITVPMAPKDTANTNITAINAGTKTLTVGSIAGLSNGDGVLVVRGASRTTIVYAQITSAPTGSNVVLDTIAGILVGDRLVKAASATLGRAFQRFPIVPAFAPQIITAIDTGTKRLSVSSALSFTVGDRVFVQTSKYQDVVEAVLVSRDTTNNYLFLSSVAGISVGHLITQPYSETEIAPSSYIAGMLEEVTGVNVEQKSTNGIVITNSNPYDVVINPYVTVI